MDGERFGDDPGDDAGEVDIDVDGDRENTESGGEDEADEVGEDSVRSEGRLGTGGSLRGITLLPLVFSRS